MAENEKAQVPARVGDRFPALKQREEEVERAKLDQALAEARAAAAKAKLPSVGVERAKLDQALAEAQAASAKAKLPDLDVELARDAITASDKTSGLARVLVQMDSIALADDIADLVLDAARADTPPSNDSRTYSIRLVSDPALLSAVDVHRLLGGQLRYLNDRINELAPPPERDSTTTDMEDQIKAAREEVVPLAAVAAAVSVGVQAVGLASKLFARDYHISGGEVPVDGLGFDLELAHYLKASHKVNGDETVVVDVERLTPTPESSKIVNSIWALAEAADKQVRPVVAAHALRLAEAKAVVEMAKAAIDALNLEIIELTKRVADQDKSALGTALHELTERRQMLQDAMPESNATLAEAQATYERGTALLVDIEEFLTTALTPGSGGGRPPALEAARIEDLVTAGENHDGRFLLYARPIAGGLDQVIETKLGPDHFRALAGASAEFALLGSGGRLLASGVRSALQSTTMKLGDPDESFRQVRPNYMALGRADTS